MVPGEKPLFKKEEQKCVNFFDRLGTFFCGSWFFFYLDSTPQVAITTNHQSIKWNWGCSVDDITESDDAILSLWRTLQATLPVLRPPRGPPPFSSCLRRTCLSVLSAVLRLIRSGRQGGGVNGFKWRGFYRTIVSPLTMRTAQLLTPAKAPPHLMMPNNHTDLFVFFIRFWNQLGSLNFYFEFGLFVLCCPDKFQW